MSSRRRGAGSGLVVPTLLCSLAGAAGVLALTMTGVAALEVPQVQPAPPPAVVAPARVSPPPQPAPPPVTDAPVAVDWTAQYPPPSR